MTAGRCSGWNPTTGSWWPWRENVWHRAAVEGYASEQYNLGVMYQTGFGLPKDMAKAREWFQKAADQGDVQAKSVLKKLR